MHDDFISDATFEEEPFRNPRNDEYPVTVSCFATRVQGVLDSHLPTVWIQGEISNFTVATSGHWYFLLKDDRAQLRCVMFRSHNRRLDWTPRNGQSVELKGPAAFYAPGGQFQITVESLRPGGLGRLHEAFLRLREQLSREGLFDQERKRPLPSHPRSIGLVTSPAAAALRDVLTTLKRRAPGIPVILYPVPVQGDEAAIKIARMLATANQRAECDVLILCRGGGSLEDLWAFNEEPVARAMAASRIPVITGIGHETDFTIADFVADVRAPTPTAAAELITPDRPALLAHLGQLSRRFHMVWQRLEERESMRHDHTLQRMQRVMQRLLEKHSLHLEKLGMRLVHPGDRINQRKERLQNQQARLQRAMRTLLNTRQQQLSGIVAGLGHLNPEAVLSRGFSLVRDAQGRLVRSGEQLSPGASIAIHFASGGAEATVDRIVPAKASPPQKNTQ